MSENKGRFTKGDPRILAGHKVSGRPKKSVVWKKAENKLREALPRLLLMEKNDLQALLASNPNGAEMLAAKYIHEHVVEAVNRFLGKPPTPLTGADGDPLIPEQTAPVLPVLSFRDMTEEEVDRFIAATAAARRAASMPSPDAPQKAADPPPATP